MIHSNTARLHTKIGIAKNTYMLRNETNTVKLHKGSAVVGLIAPIYYFVLVGILGKMWSAYNPIAQYVSVLGDIGSPFKNIMNVFGFMGLGVMILIFSLGFYLSFKKNLFMKIAQACLAIAGIFLIAIGFFPCDSQCISVTDTGKLHSIISIAPISFPFAAIFFALGIPKYQGWNKGWKALSIISGFGAITAGSLLLTAYLHPYAGFVQRIGIGLCLLWMFCVSTKILKDISWHRY